MSHSHRAEPEDRRVVPCVGVERRFGNGCKRSPSNCCVYDTCIIKSILRRSRESRVTTWFFQVSRMSRIGAELNSWFGCGFVNGTKQERCVPREV